VLLTLVTISVIQVLSAEAGLRLGAPPIVIGFLTLW